MSKRIDEEIERMKKAEQMPKTIEVGEDLYEELYQEQNPPLIAALVGPGEAAPVHTDKEVKEYKGIRVFHMGNVAKDHLNISPVA